jgi:hypothetical protein
MITEEEWNAFMDDAHQALDRFKVPDPERQELVAIIESTKDAIVVSPFQEGLSSARAKKDPEAAAKVDEAGLLHQVYGACCTSSPTIRAAAPRNIKGSGRTT